MPLGHNVNGFEEDLTRYLGEPGKHVVALSAGTAALHLGLVMLGVGRDDEVRIFHSKMQFGVELALLRTPPPPLGGREEQVASCRNEKRDDALTDPLRLMQYICC